MRDQRAGRTLVSPPGDLNPTGPGILTGSPDLNVLAKITHLGYVPKHTTLVGCGWYMRTEAENHAPGEMGTSGACGASGATGCRANLEGGAACTHG